MKRTVIILLAVFVFLSGCNYSNESTTEVETETTHAESNHLFYTDNPSMKERVINFNYEDYIHERGDFSIEWSGIVSEETAGEVATAVLKQYQREGFFVDYQLQLIKHDSEKGIWLAVFWPEPLMPGADMSIAFREDNMQIVGIWVGE